MQALVIALTLIASKPITGASLYIHQIRPKISLEQARILGKAIECSAKRWGIEVEILEAILAQESYFNSELKRCYPRKLPNGCPTETCDLGLGQVNWDAWGKKLNLNQCRLRTDDLYGIDVAAHILSIVRKKADPEEENWWSRYHDSRPNHRAFYENLVIARMATSEN